ncbi:hypothetical protein [Streptomyces leeuwenhoekii]|uniref:hypothetical protein n=1 Tax=Streptomyces leeuwenhoekii TaxID=1437453 RepID=UPI0004946B36|nr:hypothetical protein [Streptomyces leeuwenhoekii]
MGHHAAAQHPDADGVVQEDQIDGGFHVVDELVVLGVEAVLVVHGQVPGAAAAFEVDRGEPDVPQAAEVVEQFPCPGGRGAHRRHQVGTDGR